MASGYTKQFFADLFERRPDAIDRALIVLWRRQTADEQSTGTTRHTNERGFAQNDARFLSALAQQALRRGSLSTTQRQCALFSRRGKPRLVKYWRQLAEEAKAKQERIREQMATAEARDPRNVLQQGW